MEIQSAQYIFDSVIEENISIKAVINNQTIFVPFDQANKDYAEIMRLVETGTLTIAPADEE